MILQSIYLPFVFSTHVDLLLNQLNYSPPLSLTQWVAKRYDLSEIDEQKVTMNFKEWSHLIHYTKTFEGWFK